MKVKELMIGDWVTYNDHLIQVENVYKDMINYCPDIPYVQEEDYISENEISPIPLTAEILEKNGFEIEKTSIVFEDWKVYKHKEFDFWCNLHREYGYYVSTQTIEDDYEELQHADFANIHYVHELQHALRLCGLNDLADNFKV